MSEPTPRRPTFLHRVEFAVFCSIEWLLRRISMGACVAGGRLLGGLFYLLSSRYRLLVRRNLRIVTAQAPPGDAALTHLVRETFQRAGANFLASLKTPTLEPKELTTYIQETGFEHLLDANRKGQGVVIAMPHMGNWEALSQLRSTFHPNGHSGGVYRPLDNPLMDELTRRRRTADGAKLFSRKDGFHAPAAFLKEKGVLVILADQRAGGRGTALPFFGKLTTCSPLPDLLARRGKARLATLGIVTLSAERWQLILSPLSGDSGNAGIMQALEHTIRHSLADVFWFHDRWRIDSARPLSFFTKIDPEIAAQSTVPLRLLLTAPSGEWQGVQRMLDTMFELRPDLRIDLLTPEALSPHDSRIVVHPFDQSLPPEQHGGLYRKIDDSHPAPLDGALLLDNHHSLACVARRARLRAILGLDVQGKPWSASLPRPKSTADWQSLAEAMARVPKRHQS